MKNWIACCFLLVFMLAAMMPLQAAHYNNRDGNIQFDVADTWPVMNANPLVLSSPRGDIILCFEVIKAEDTQSALIGSEASLLRYMQSIKKGETRNVNINGLEGVAVDGTAKVNEIPVVFTLSIVPAQKKLYTLFFYYGAPGAAKNNIDDINAFLKSIKRIR
ncbi:MAG: hypothetical protein RDV48_12175 [Candidatus Eremiobacteraeota bacterium]|nr:hypothetical protein [Candidatus Eremiobacteraeota bacterium]